MNVDKLKENLEKISAEVHNAWWDEKKKQGFHAPKDCSKATPTPTIGKEEAMELWFTKHCDKCHADMYNYDVLADNIQEYDRATVRAVISACEKI